MNLQLVFLDSFFGYKYKTIEIGQKNIFTAFFLKSFG